MMWIVILLAVIGFSIALYTYLLEQKVKKDPNYKPVCDISDNISCTKPMQSQYSNIFFFSNALIAMIFYSVIAILAFLNAQIPLLVVASIGIIASAILAYLLYFKIKSLCILCTAMYIINILIFIIALAHK